MGLENYSRNQKIFVATLIIMLASMFTITGAMTVVLGGENKGNPAEAAKVGKDKIRYFDYTRMRRALGLVASLDSAAYNYQAEVKETLYARVPTLATREESGHEWPGNATMPVTVSLLDVWPQWQDQNLWCHMVLVKRAKEAGIEPPSNARVGDVLTALLNARRQEFEKFTKKDLEKEFKKNFSDELSDLLPTFREALMVHDYVDSQLAQYRASLDEVAAIVGGDSEEMKAEVVRLSIDAFMQRARQEVLRESFAWRSSQLAGGFGVATPGMGYDAIEEAFDKNSGKELNEPAHFRFDVIQAYPSVLLNDGKIPIDETRIELTYQAVRDEMFKASDTDKAQIEARLEAAKDRYARLHTAETKDWDEAKWLEWKNKQRPEMMQYRLLDEVQADLIQTLQRENSVPAAQAAVAELMRKLADIKQKRERDLNAGLEVIRKEQAVIDGVKSYLESLRQRFTSMDEQVWIRMTAIGMRLPAKLDDAELKRMAEDMARELQNLEREQVQGLRATAGSPMQDLERMRDDKRAQRDDFVAKEPKKNDFDQLMSDAEIDAKLKGFDLDIEAITEKIKARDQKLPLVEAFADAMRAVMVNFELAARMIGEPGDEALRASTLRAMLLDAPAALSKFAKDQADVIVPQSEIDDWDGRSQLIAADISARQNAVRKDAADTRGLKLEEMCQQSGLRMVNAGERDFTWEQVVANESLNYLDFVEGAKSFLEDPNNSAGMVSNLMALPGKGYILLRLREKTPKYAQGHADSQQRTLTLAAMKRARELTIEAMKEVRRDVVKNGWDAAIKRAQEKFGAHLSLVKTDWFTDKMDVPEIYSDADSELLGFSSTPSATTPDQPLMQRLKDMPTRDKVTELIPSKRNEDALRRPDMEQWGYMLARAVDRRNVAHRISDDKLKEDQPFYMQLPSDIWRTRHLAGSELVRDLVTPAALLKDTPVVLYKPEENKKANGPANDK
ncbi:MAG: hypothetical protein IPP14_05280 [Planctomycetes bacterium]|nr:hypothetical protein [Planctomycetota bacterium]